MNNPVAKNMPKVHRPTVEVDRKREEKKTGDYLKEGVIWVDPTNGDVWTIDLPTEED